MTRTTCGICGYVSLEIPDMADERQTVVCPRCSRPTYIAGRIEVERAGAELRERTMRNVLRGIRRDCCRDAVADIVRWLRGERFKCEPSLRRFAEEIADEIEAKDWTD